MQEHTPLPHVNQRYRLLSQLGQGGMGTVYRALDRLTNTVVALKQVSVPAEELNFTTSASEPTLNLAQEFRTLAGLRHPHIVSVLDYGFDAQQHPYYTMQLLENAQPLTDYARALGQQSSAGLMMDVLQALVYLHRRGIVHRDLKPGNVLVTADGVVKVLDFGLALQMDAHHHLREEVIIAGTLAYMAPELFGEKPASVASDLYAVGVIAYELFAGRRPFDSDSAGALIGTILLTEPDFTPIPPALIPVIGRLLAKDPEARFASAHEAIIALCTALGIPLPAESALVRESFLQASTFVGRQQEQRRLHDALAQTFQKQGSLWLIGGESGVGKSRLLDEFRSWALVKGTLVLHGQAVAGGGLPFELWREALRRLVLHVSLSDLEASVLKPIVPDIALLLGRDVPDAPPLPGMAGQQRVTLTIVDLLKRCDQTILILMEDIHWAEESLVPIRQMLMTRDQFAHVMLVGSYRDDERPTLPDELPGVQLLKLTRLDETALEALAESMLGETGRQPAVLELLRRETEGNAFFMVETVRALAEEAGALVAVDTATLPRKVLAGGIQQVIQRRLSRLPQTTLPLLKRAAVAGRAIDEAVLRHYASPDEVAAFIAAGDNVGVLHLADGGWRFSHDKLREGVLLTLTPDEKHSLHRETAQALETIYPDDARYHEILLDHWTAARDEARILFYLIPVALYLTEFRADFVRAEALAEQGVSLLAADDARQATLLGLLSRVNWRKADYAAGQQLAQQAYTLAQQLGDLKTAADSLNLLGTLAWHRGDPPAAIAFQEQALALQRQVGNHNGVAVSLNNLGIIRLFSGDYQTARQYFEQGLETYRQAHYPLGIASCLNNLGLVTRAQADYAAAQAYFEQGLALFREIGMKPGVAGTLNNLGDVARMQADFPAAAALYERSLALRREIGDQPGIAESLAGLGAVQVVQGVSCASETLREALRISAAVRAVPTMLDIVVSWGHLLLHQRQPAQAAVLAGLAENHPALTPETHGHILAALTDMLKAVLPADKYTFEIERGRALDLQAVVADIIG